MIIVLRRDQPGKPCPRCHGLGSLPATSRIRPGSRKVVEGYVCPECGGSGRKAA